MKGDVYPNQPFLIHVHIKWPLSWPLFRPLRVPFPILLLIPIRTIHELPLTQPVLTLTLLSRIHELFELPQIVHPVTLSLLHAPLAMLLAQILILTSNFRSFCSWIFSTSSMMSCLTQCSSIKIRIFNFLAPAARVIPKWAATLARFVFFYLFENLSSVFQFSFWTEVFI